MFKKRLNSCRGQITIFMILGLFILFIAVFVIMLTTNVKKSELSGQQEKVLTQLFQKEALRIYVEDCLKDNLEEGLILLGKQGTLWEGQAGGSKPFVLGNTGIEYKGENVLYGIIRNVYATGEYPLSYPCKTNKSDEPAFCQYAYPQSAPQSAEFGKIILKNKFFVENDLENFLINRTIWCVENFTKSNISKQAEVVSTTLTMTADMQDEGINIAAEYPLKIKLGKEELFQLTKFDFFYPTKFKQVLETAIISSLQSDQQIVDFNYSEEVLKSDTFEFGSLIDTKENCSSHENYYLCHRKTSKEGKYVDLGINMTKDVVGSDDVYHFTVPAQNVLQDTSGTFVFNIARQNRPPALDYVHRAECAAEGYDYLVVPGNDKYGDINITLNAHDADEDDVNYGFEQNKIFPITPIQKNILVSTQNLPLGLFNITTYASDGFLTDSQIVRVLVDQPMKTSFSLSGLYNSSGKDMYYNGTKDGIVIYQISAEDPVYLAVDVGAGSNSNTKATLSYGVINQQVFTSQIGAGIYNFSFPGDYSGGKYNYNFTNWDAAVSANNIFQTTTDNGILKLSSSKTYCGEDINSSQEAKIVVKRCIPYVNPTHPYPVIPNTVFYLYNNVTNKDEDINPFLATHSCCNEDWTLKPNGESCYVESQPTTCIDEVYLAQKNHVCDGKRGNLCGGEEGKKILYQDQLICGNKLISNQCESTICSGKFAFDFIKDDIGVVKGWCEGKGGCNNICILPVVDLSGLKSGQKYNLSQIARTLFNVTSQKKISPVMLNVSCGCTSFTINKPCDKDFDGVFEGACEDQGGTYACAFNGGKA